MFNKINSHNEWDKLREIIVGSGEGLGATIEWHSEKKISEDICKTPAQVVLRWALERGTAIIPKTVKLERLKENIELYDFKLTDEQVNIISSLNCDRRFNDPAIFCKKSFGKFHPIYD